MSRSLNDIIDDTFVDPMNEVISILDDLAYAFQQEMDMFKPRDEIFELLSYKITTIHMIEHRLMDRFEDPPEFVISDYVLELTMRSIKDEKASEKIQLINAAAIEAAELCYDIVCEQYF